jgi:tellurite resistance protein TerC
METMMLLEFLGKPIWMWAAFMSVVLALLVFDLGVLNKKDHVIGVKESLKLSAFYISIGLLFGAGVWSVLGPDKGMEYLTGFVVEKSLAMDNVFVIAMIFGYLAIPPLYQHRVLFWGILGVLILRGIMIGLGAALVSEYHWILYFFAAFLIITGVKMLVTADKKMEIGDNPILRFMNKHFRISKEMHGHDFWVKKPDPKTGKLVWFMTPLLICLVLIEFADVIFAVDSVPAIFAITTDPYIVYTSNIFAILGLRALYFALAAMVDRFEYLKYALSVLLIFIGSKIFIGHFLLESGKFPPSLSLALTFVILATGVFYSLWKTRKLRSSV